MMSFIFSVATFCASFTSFASSKTVTLNVARSGTANTSPSPETVIVLVAVVPEPTNLNSLNVLMALAAPHNANATSAIVAALITISGGTMCNSCFGISKYENALITNTPMILRRGAPIISYQQQCFLGWLMGLEPTTAWTTTRSSTS